MTARDLFAAFGQIDDDLVLDAARPAKRRTVRVQFRKFVPLAACLCVAAAGGVYALMQTRMDGAMPELAAAQDSAKEETTADSAPMIGAAPDDAAEDWGVGSGLAESTDTADTLESLLLGATAGGGYDLLAHSADELYFAGDLLDDLSGGAGDTALPETMTVYRNDLLDGGADEAALRARLEALLTALGLDPALAETAELYADDAATQQVTDEALRADGRMTGLVGYWAGAAYLYLNVPACGAWPDGLNLTVYNDQSVSVLAGGDAEPRILDGKADKDAAAAALTERYGDILTALLGEGYAEHSDGGDRSSYGEASTVFMEFDAAGGDGAFRYAIVSVTADGALSALHLTDRQLTALGNYDTVPRAEADEALAAGNALRSGSLTDEQRAEAAAGGENLVSLRLVYTRTPAAYYVPLWEYVIDAGEAAEFDCQPDGAQPLHRYVFCYVPAVSGFDPTAAQ